MLIGLKDLMVLFEMRVHKLTDDAKPEKAKALIDTKKIIASPFNSCLQPACPQ
jgi:hypothetical protein